jgi:hypothetical protein
MKKSASAELYRLSIRYIIILKLNFFFDSIKLYEQMN